MKFYKVKQRLTKKYYEDHPEEFKDEQSTYTFFKKNYPNDELGFALFRADAKNVSSVLNSQVSLIKFNKNKNNILYYINLIGDAKSKSNRFAICSEFGEPLYYGKFFEGVDENFSDDEKQYMGELFALKYAMELVHNTCILHKINPENVHLNYFTDNENLAGIGTTNITFGSHQFKKWTKKYKLSFKAFWIRGIDNVADEYTLKQYTYLYPQHDKVKKLLKRVKK